MNEITKRLHDHKLYVYETLAERGLHKGVDYLVEGIYLQGSQNYGVHTEESDVDSKLVLIPTVRSLVRGTKLTFDIDVPCADGTVEKCSIKPYKEFEALFFKGSFNNLEILFTEHSLRGNCGSIIQDFMWCKREELVKKSFPCVVSACLGMQNQKKAALYKCTEGTRSFFEEHGYDNKNLIHIIRIAHTIDKYYNLDESFEDSLLVTDCNVKDVIGDIRKGIINKKHVNAFVEMSIQTVEDVRNRLQEGGEYDKMHSELPKFRAEIEDSTSELIESVILEVK